MNRDHRLPGLDDCVHCGLCLPVCPTYAIDRREAQNPRGRIAALRAIDEGRAELSPALRAGLEDCLVCRACESACPSGISMEGLLLEHRARTRTEGTDLRTRAERTFLRRVVPSPTMLDRFLGFARFGRAVLPQRLAPEGPARSRLRPASPPTEVLPAGEPRATVAMLRGCVADRVQARETLDAARLLAHFGYRVLLGEAGCCGALHRHAGLREEAIALSRARARALLRCFPEHGVLEHGVLEHGVLEHGVLEHGVREPGVAEHGIPTHIVVDSAGCGSALLEPLIESADEAPELHAVAERVTDTPSLLVAEPLPPVLHPIPGPVAFFPPCHQAHGTGTTAATRTLLEHIVDGPVLDLPGEDHCCGAAGMYFLRRPEKSRELGARAFARWEAAGRPPIVATGNPGCLMRWETLLRGTQPAGGSNGEGTGAEAVHPVTLAARAYGVGGAPNA